jgi:uncharacterized protein (TIGR02594 family)
MLPKPYAWLADEGAPKMLVEMLRLHGTVETPGARDNPAILAWAKEVGLERVYTDDSIPWCGLAMAVVAKRAGKPVVKDPLWALNWRKFGVPVERPMLGDVIVKTRKGGGHVTLYVGEDSTAYHCLGANQSDQVNVARYLKTDNWSFRRPIWSIAQPANVRVVKLAAGGAPIGARMS